MTSLWNEKQRKWSIVPEVGIKLENTSISKYMDPTDIYNELKLTLSLNRESGSLSFLIGGENQGVAFTHPDFSSKTFYPFVGLSNGKVAIDSIY